jgi:hypothetical protein
MLAFLGSDILNVAILDGMEDPTRSFLCSIIIIIIIIHSGGVSSTKT